MTDTSFKPIVYLKQHCPFCLKVRIFLLEAGLRDRVETRAFAPGTPEETEIRGELRAHLEPLTFPAAQLAPGQYRTEADQIVADLAAMFDRDPATMPVYRDYVDGPFAMAMSLWKENQALKSAAAAV